MISDQLKYYPDDVDYSKMYERLKPVIDKRGAKTDPLTLYYFTYASLLRSSLDPSLKEQYVKDQTYADKLFAEAKASAERPVIRAMPRRSPATRPPHSRPLLPVVRPAAM